MSPQEHFKTLIRHLPQIEPLLFVCRFVVVPDDEYTKIVPKRGSKKAPQTACATPNGFFFQQTFWDALPANKQAGLILHEVLHPALMHLSDPYRDRSLSPQSFAKLSNIAQDVVIENAIHEIANQIQQGRPVERRDIAAYGPYFPEFKGMSWREVYAILRAKVKPGSKPEEGDGNGLPSNIDEHSDPDEFDQSDDMWDEARKEMEEIKDKIDKGEVAGGAKIEVKVEKPVVPWQRYLAEYLSSIPAPTRKTWSSIKRRPFSTGGIYVPTMAGTRYMMGRINLLLDCSGSMHADYGRMAGEVLSICTMAASVHRVDYDVGIAYQEVIEEPETYEIGQVHGGGGTSLRLTLEQLKLRDDFDQTAPCVVLTDGEDDFNVADLGLRCVFVTYRTMVYSNAGPCFKVGA